MSMSLNIVNALIRLDNDKKAIFKNSFDTLEYYFKSTSCDFRNPIDTQCTMSALFFLEIFVDPLILKYQNLVFSVLLLRKFYLNSNIYNAFSEPFAFYFLIYFTRNNHWFLSSIGKKHFTNLTNF